MELKTLSAQYIFLDQENIKWQVSAYHNDGQVGKTTQVCRNFRVVNSFVSQVFITEDDAKRLIELKFQEK